MADDAQNSEASASDLASMWGMAASGGSSSSSTGGSTTSSTSSATGSSTSGWDSVPPPPVATPVAPSSAVPESEAAAPKKRRRRRRKKKPLQTDGTQQEPVVSEVSQPPQLSEASAADLASLWSAPATPAVPAAPVSTPIPPATPTPSPAPRVPEPEPQLEPEQPQSYQPPAQDTYQESYEEVVPEPVAEPVIEPAEEPIKEPEPRDKAERETLEGEVVSDESVQDDKDEEIPQEDEGFLDRIDILLSEIGISRNTIAKGCCSVVVIGALITAGFYIVPRFLGDEKNPDEQDVETPKTPDVPSDLDPSISSSILIGSRSFLGDEFFPSTGVEESVKIGTNEDARTALRRAIILLRRIRSTYETDVSALLNASQNRRGVLSNHLTLLESLYDEGNRVLPVLQSEAQQYQSDFESISTERDTAEKDFFNELKSLNPEAEVFLEVFVDSSDGVNNTKARFRALDNLILMYQSAMPRVAARIKDIELNEEPLIKGIEVFDVKGSDLKLILDGN
ncbi:MAG: hypothetical protein AAB592_01340 [Patescibacteria group bacterium]